MVTNHRPSASVVVARWASRPGKAVIFDFNGTLSDDEPILLHLFSDMFLEHLGWRLEPNYYFSVLAGRSDREIIEAVVSEQRGSDPTLVENLLAERRVRYFELVARESPIRDETIKLVEFLTLSRVPLGIVTGAQRPDVDYVLAGRGLTTSFPTIISEEDVAHGKPDPEGFRIAAAAMQVSPDSVLVFEDSIYGIRAAKAAGMYCIAVTGTRTAGDLSPAADAVVDHLDTQLFTILSGGIDD